MSIKPAQNDPFMRFMNGKGYMPIVHPKSGVSPPVVLTLKGDQYFDTREIVELLTSRKLSTDGLVVDYQAAADFEKDLSNNQSGKVSIGFLGNILSKLGIGGDPKVAAHANHGDQTKYCFQGVSIKSVSPGLIRDRIHDLKPDDFDSDDLRNGNVYIAYQYVYAKKLIVGTGDNLAAGFDASVDIHNAAKIEVSAGGDRVRIDMASFNGEEPVAFGFKAGQLSLKDGKYHFEWLMPPGVGLVAEADRSIVIKNAVFGPAET